MDCELRINKSLKVPIYQQIFNWVVDELDLGKLKSGDQLPSINQISANNSLAKETVVKAFKLLQEKGIVVAVHGKGFFIKSNETIPSHRVFLLFDTLTSYKEIMYQSIINEFGEDAFIDIYFHHYNPKVFEKLVKDATGNYTAYIVLPFDSPNINELLDPIPFEKLYLLDRYPKIYKNEYHGVCQDFYNDIIEAMDSVKGKIHQYKKLSLLFWNLITDLPLELLEGFESYCNQFNIEFEIHQTKFDKSKIEKNTGYFVIDDHDLVALIEHSKEHNWKIGKDLGIISYNDSPFKKVIGDGISVISTDFAHMGTKIARMVIENDKNKYINPSQIIGRGSF